MYKAKVFLITVNNTRLEKEDREKHRVGGMRELVEDEVEKVMKVEKMEEKGNTLCRCN